MVGLLNMSLSLSDIIELTDFKNTPLSHDPSETLKSGFQDVDEDIIKSEDL